MTFTKHGHHIPDTALYTNGVVPIKSRCGGPPFCNQCKEDSERVMDVNPSAECIIDKDPKKVEVAPDEFLSGDIPWCNAHHCEPSVSGEVCLLKEAYLNGDVEDEEETVPDILRSISENCGELAEAFFKLACILEDKKD